MTLPLEDVRIVEMGQLIAMPAATKLLADMGAQVIRIESCTRLELYRAISFYQNNSTGEYWNRGANFYEQNRNKLGLTLDLNKPNGLNTLRELVSISDVFAQNFTPRVTKKFNLEYDDLRQIKPDIIVVSSTGYGYSGPWGEFGAIGYSTESASGLSYVTGYSGGPPELPEIPYADYVAAEHTVFAIMLALIHRSHTGQGQFIDVSQTETVSSTIPETLMDYTVNGRISGRMGNQDPVMAPHGCYPCLGDDKWIAIAVRNNAQWEALCQVLGNPSWGVEARFCEQESRWKHREELDAKLREITAHWDHLVLTHSLQERGVPAGAVLNNKELLYDPHLQDRHFLETMSHPVSTNMPPLPYSSRPWKMSETPGSSRHPAPVMGQHNKFVLSEVLGKSRSELKKLEQEEVIGHEPTKQPPLANTSLEEMKNQGYILDYEKDFESQLERDRHE